MIGHAQNDLTKMTDDRPEKSLFVPTQGLRTPNERRNQRNLKICPDVEDKICFGPT